MADIAVENKDAPVIEKEVEEADEATPKVVAAADEDDAAEIVDKPTDAANKAGENGSKVDADDETPQENGTSTVDDATTAASDKTDDVDDEDSKDEKDTTNGDSTDAPAEAVKRKPTESCEKETAEDKPTPEKKAKLDDAVDANGAETTEVAA